MTTTDLRRFHTSFSCWMLNNTCRGWLVPPLGRWAGVECDCGCHTEVRVRDYELGRRFGGQLARMTASVDALRGAADELERVSSDDEFIKGVIDAYRERADRLEGGEQ